jgi:hypothetical protein
LFGARYTEGNGAWRTSGDTFAIQAGGK